MRLLLLLGVVVLAFGVQGAGIYPVVDVVAGAAGGLIGDAVGGFVDAVAQATASFIDDLVPDVPFLPWPA